MTDRLQRVKFNSQLTEKKPLTLGVAQGSCLGALFFLLFINYLAFLLDLKCKMFADDTTLYESGGNLDNLISHFEKGIEPLIEWCELNKLDINWSKTFFMIITNKHWG